MDLEIRVPGLVNLEDSLTNVYWIGGRSAHPEGVNWHMVSGVVGALQSIADTLRSSYGGQTLYLQYNDASLPSGGTFTWEIPPHPLEDPWQPHVSHALGLDIDIAFCYAEYSGNDNQIHRVFDCSSRPELRVSQADLDTAAELYNGVNRIHDGNHYHIRFRN